MLRLLLSAVVLVSLCTVEPISAQERREPLADRVKKSIDQGVKFLREQQREDGSWEVNLPSAGIQGGWSALALLSLLNAGVPPSDFHVDRGLKYLRGLDPSMTYVRALQTMVFVEAKQPQDRLRIAQNVQWLIDARVLKDGRLQGWTYTKTPAALNTDNSNTQYAMLGLWAGQQHGVKINREIWEGIREYYLRVQDKDGGWNYSPKGGPAGHGQTSMTMTTAGLCGLLIAGMELNSGREQLQKDGSARNCGDYDDSTPAAMGMNWISRGFTLNIPQRTFYHLYGLERAGRLTGQRFFGNHDWYREGCNYLVGIQKEDGSFKANGAWDQWPVVSTSFGLLFLSKGRTPVLMSKLVHGAWPRDPLDLDWNNDRNDLRHFTDYCSKQLFKDLPLAWQTFDVMRAIQPRGNQAVTEDDLLEVTSDLLQSPIVYFNGHKSPKNRFKEVEKDILRRYVENGGFILAEACCNSPEFDQGFKALCEDLWPHSPLEYLDEKHSIWTSHFAVGPGDPYKLMGIKMGCKTVLVYSPQDMSCQWENNAFEDRAGRGDRAFKLGANIIAYATGMEPPQPRLTKTDVAANKEDTRTNTRGYLEVGQIKFRGDWQPAPRAMTNLMDHMRKQVALDVVLRTKGIQVYDKGIVDYKFLYMHGRGEFAFDKEDVERLRFNLQNGGLLLADACCGKETFDKAFRTFAGQLFPDKKLEVVPPDDPLYGADLNGESLTEQNIRCRTKVGEKARNMAPYLEGIKIDNRWVLLYSKYDIGCALEKSRASDCLGYEVESAYKLASAAVLYAFQLEKR
jgi:hypothetical protein